MFRVSRAFLSVHAALWSPAVKGLASLVFYLFQQILQMLFFSVPELY